MNSAVNGKIAGVGRAPARGARRVVVVGAGIGGLCAALILAARGVEVTVLERAASPGGKLRTCLVGGDAIDAGPTVFTMRHVFEEIFAAAGADLASTLTLRRADTLARHAWDAETRLDLHADLDRAADAIGAFAGAAEARGFRAFCADARRIHATLDAPFMRADRPSMARLVGSNRPAALLGLRPFNTLWQALDRYFRDPRLRQLFGRYATYCGTSPFEATATLMLVAHVEQGGVWLVEGGMRRIATAIASLAEERGARIRTGCEVAEILTASGRCRGVRLAGGEVVEADAVVCNADAAALAGGLFGEAGRRAVTPRAARPRSLSAVTWAMRAEADGFPLDRHNVFFSRDYAAEFADIGRGRPPRDPTVYVCAQDRGAPRARDHDDVAAGDRGDIRARDRRDVGAQDRDARAVPAGAPERLLLIVNAPAAGDTVPAPRTGDTSHAPRTGDPSPAPRTGDPATATEIDRWETSARETLRRCGLTLRTRPEWTVATTPEDFATMFPATGGALYGAASRGWQASFRRPGVTSRLPGLFLAGGSVHPGPGLPMAASSGRMAAEAILREFASTSQSRPTATAGGTSTPSATTAPAASP